MPSLPHSSLSFFRSLLIFDAKMRVKNIRVRKTRVGAKKSRETTVKFSSLLFDFLFFFISLFPSLSPYSSLLPFSLLLFSSLIIYISLSSLFLFTSFSFFSILLSILPSFSFSLSISLSFYLFIIIYLHFFLPVLMRTGPGRLFYTFRETYNSGERGRSFRGGSLSQRPGADK